VGWNRFKVYTWKNKRVCDQEGKVINKVKWRKFVCDCFIYFGRQLKVRSLAVRGVLRRKWRAIKIAVWFCPSAVM
jgi:hypothetical protein